MWNKSKVLITGGTGMVAREIKSILEARSDCHVLVPDRQELDLVDKAAVAEYFQSAEPDYVFHMAAKVHGLGGNLMYPIETLSTNILINDAVLGACQFPSVKKIFFAGTVASYEYPYAALPLTEESIFSGTPHQGEFGYAMAKRVAFAYLKILNEKYQKKFVYGIYTNLYGPHDRFNISSGHVLPSLIMKLSDAVRHNQEFNVWGRPETTRDFLYARDAAAAAIHLMENAVGLFNIGSGVETAMSEVVSALTDISGYQGRVSWDTSKPVGISRRYSDVSKLLATGFNIETPLGTGLQATWDWFEAALNNKSNIRE